MNNSRGGVLDATSYSLNDRSESSAFNLDDSDLCDPAMLAMLDRPPDGMQLRKDDRYAGFDNNVGDSWIYPTNYPLRQYQFSITQAALFKNTLVVLPTGLGKTFIAASVMYNIYRWYPTGIVIFMAPTKPLVNQQIQACHNVTGISLDDTAEMTGRQSKTNRAELWRTKRVFYATPQSVQSDINSPDQIFPFERVKLVVIDEAHKAKGNYAYCEVIRAIVSRTTNFRVLALSATPGRTLEDVTEVIRNLLISHIEVRWENSIDVAQYTFKKNIRTIVTPLGPKLTRIRDSYLKIIDPYVRRLLDANAISGHVGSLSRGSLIMAHKRFRENNLIQRHPNATSINSDFSTCISMYHALELLIRHGLRAFLNFFEDTNSSNEKYFVSMDLSLKALIEELRHEYGRNPLAIFGNVRAMPNGVVPAVANDDAFDFGHPKFAILERHLREHFEGNPQSKAMVFSEYRDSVAMIHRLLLRNRPLIKPKYIVGQGTPGGTGLPAVSQKEQIATMRDFRSGQCNTLVATCVAEEGIDVGEVDLIVCFDIVKNPTRFVQRIGRTGRQAVGRVLMLVTEGKEHETLKEVLASKDKTNRALSKSREILNVLYRGSPRLVPTEFAPRCVQTFIKVPEKEERGEGEGGKRGKRGRPAKEDRENAGESSTAETRGKRRKKGEEVAPRGTQDVRKFFRKTEADLDESEREVFCSPTKDTSVDSANTSKDRLTVPTDKSIRVGKTDEEQELERLMKPLLRHKARLGREQFLNGGKLIEIGKESIIKSILCPNVIKKVILEANLPLLKEVSVKSDVLQATSADSESVILLDDAGESVRTETSSFENLFGGRSALKARIAELEESRKWAKRMRRSPLGEPDIEIPTNDAIVADFQTLYDQLSEFSFSAIAKPLPESARAVPDAIDPVVLSQLEESRYLAQVPDETPKAPESRLAPLFETRSPLDDTPINRNKAKSRVATLAKKTPADSPLLRAFNRSIAKAKNSDTIASPAASSRSKDLGVRMALEFFHLNSVDQMFEESGSDGERTEAMIVESVADLSRTLFDAGDLSLAAQEAAFIAGNFEGEEDSTIARKEIEDLEAALLADDESFPEVDRPALNGSKRINPEIAGSSTIVKPAVDVQIDQFLEDSPTKVEPGDRAGSSGIPIDRFLREAFPSEPSPVKPTPRQSPRSLARRMELLDCEILAEFLEDSQDEEEIPNSQENVPPPRKYGQPATQKTLNVGELDDFLADSNDEDLFDLTIPSRTTPAVAAAVEDGYDTDKTVDYDVGQALKQIIPSTPPSRPKLLDEKSPSLLRKKINFSRLQVTRSSGTLEVNSAPVVRSSSAPKSSPFFGAAATQQPVPTVSPPDEDEPSFVIAPKRKAATVISSDEEEEVFLTARSKTSAEMNPPAPPPQRVRKRRRRNECDFFLSQAAVSDDDEDHGGDDDSNEHDSHFVDDSIVYHGPVEDDAVDMRARYLQSVRSPINARAAFKIPAQPRRQMNLSEIYSQLPGPDDELHDDGDLQSFIVHEDQDEVVDGSASSSSMDELERAEAILRERRRQGRENKKKKGGRVVVRPSSDSD
ncbi:uncharacterized protein LOC6050823 [Culex quinquefasciatus]|uniref:uncharacterized protein LOC6050823 n=1 Tax=Culex quinquefasciatus TaxID=7176 RepID=UPI0018E322EC|nr:uncharacterized protein LOC6050823 [Culex quinquefasciatus]